MKLFKKKKRRRVVVRSIEGRARPIPGVKKPSYEEVKKAEEKFVKEAAKYFKKDPQI